MLDLPEVSIDNYTNLYPYYTDLSLDPTVIGDFFAEKEKEFSPDISMDSPDIPEEVDHLVAKEGFSVAVFSNHHHPQDHEFAASAIGQGALGKEIQRRPMTTVVKDEFPRTADPDTRRKMDELGLIPAFREKNYGRMRVARPGIALINTCLARAAQGISTLMYPEGTFNLENPKKIMDINHGAGYLVHQAGMRGINLLVLTVGLANISGTTARLHISDPRIKFAGKSKEISSEIKDGMQDAVDKANRPSNSDDLFAFKAA